MNNNKPKITDEFRNENVGSFTIDRKLSDEELEQLKKLLNESADSYKMQEDKKQ